MDEEEIDIEGEYTSELGNTEATPLYFDNELPSTSVNLTPEYTQHPWLLEQGWASDYFTDERSKATIEKMLLEEEGLLGPNKHLLSPRRVPLSSINDVVDVDQDKSDDHLEHVEFEAILMDNDGIPTSDASFPSLLGATTTCITTTDPPQEVELEETVVSAPVNAPASAPPRSKRQKKVHKTSKKTAKKGKVGRPRNPDVNTVICHSETINISSKTAEDDEDFIIDIEADDDEDTISSLVVDIKDKSTALLGNGSDIARARKPVLSSPELSSEPDSFSTPLSTPKEEPVAPSGSSPNIKTENLEMSCSNQSPDSSQDKTNNDDSVDLVLNDSKDDNDNETLSENEFESSDQPEIKPDHWGVLTSKGTVVYLPNPKLEARMEAKVVTEEEQDIHSEFFDGRPGLKTEERYLKIRNYIIDSWKNTKPKYLYKTAVREGLKNCGDVNCIGRIHAYLEQKGVINFGCELAQYNCKREPNPVRKRSKHKVDKAMIRNRSELIASRKRRVRGDDGSWINEKDLEGVTIQHENGTEKVHKQAKKKRNTNKSSDPFQLVPCRQFEDSGEPFRVAIEAEALVMMDVHSHLSKTEVIGLVGGEFHESDSVLQVKIVQPCRSVSTGMQCDMDPVSQAQACEAIHGQGLSVVGWYHSHPSFKPDPSLRDLETQTEYQTWFAKGGCPFIGIIINPFGSTNRLFNSEVRCLHIQNSDSPASSDETLAPEVRSLLYKVPYKFDFQVSTSHWNAAGLLDKLCSLVGEYNNFSHRIDIDQIYVPGMDHTVKQKMMYSALDYVRDDCGSKSEELHSILTQAFSTTTESNS